MAIGHEGEGALLREMDYDIELSLELIERCKSFGITPLDFTKLHQMPLEERYKYMDEKRRVNGDETRGNKELKKEKPPRHDS